MQRNMSPQVYRSLHPFHGDAGQGQVVLPGGVLLNGTVQQNGWIFVCLVANSNVKGWCPLSYVALEPQMEATPPSVQTNPQEAFDGPFDGFGPIMGGEAPKPIQPSPRHENSWASQPIQHSDPQDNSPRRGRIGTSFRNTGAKMGSIFKGAGSAVSRGATQAGSTVKGASTETRYRLNDMREQRHEKQSVGKAQVAPPQPQQDQRDQTGQVPRTQAKFQADVGNSAGRSAVASGLTSFVMSGGSVSSAARGATAGAVWGGTHGAVQQWKPFGNGDGKK
jgi:hypothetical protein